MGVTRFIDHALAGFLAPLAGPFRAGLADFEAQYRSGNPAQPEFASLTPVRQVEWLRQVEHTPFFESLQQLTVLGALTMPEYGGNRDGLGWQLIGFADQHAFTPPFGYYDRDYPGFGAAERGARKLGLHSFPAPMAINSQPYRGRPACIHCGFCHGFACEVQAKSSTLFNMIPEAEADVQLRRPVECGLRA